MVMPTRGSLGSSAAVARRAGLLRRLLLIPIAASVAMQVCAAGDRYDAIVGDAMTLAHPTPHWFATVGDDIAYLIDGDAGEVRASLTLSMFSPAIAPALAEGRIYSYGSFYTRTYYGEREDVVLVFDLSSARPIEEIPIPPKSAGIGHRGMMGRIADRFIGVWNITPAMSVSIADTASGQFVGEISTPGCAGVYPVAAGFFMACGDGRVQYLRLDASGAEIDRIRSDAFFTVDDDPVFDYAVPTAGGWLFVSLEGVVYEVTLDNDTLVISEPWSINPPDDPDATDLNGVPQTPDDQWRISGNQPFAYNAERGLLMTLMHEGGGQETFEDPGTQIWAFSTRTRRRAYVIDLVEEGAQTGAGDVSASAIELTGDSDPLLLVQTSYRDTLQIRDALTGRLRHSMTEVGARGLQRLD